MDEFFTPARPEENRQPGSSGLPRLLAVLLVLVLFLLLPYFAEKFSYRITIGRERAQVEVAREELATPSLAQISRQFAIVAKAIGPSVVHIDTMQEVASRDGIHRTGMTQSLGQGSGVIIDEEGYILTNNHVVENASAITVNLGGNESRTAEVVGLDETTDLAVLKIPSGGLIAAQWGDSDALEVGSLVWAVGNPFGLDRSVTMGIVSAKNRRSFQGMNPYQDFLQTDAAVNPGNSGGPLVDVTGKVVGINTAIVGRAYQGVSFSIPAGIVHEVYDRIRAEGKVVRGYLGVQLRNLDEELAERLGVELAERPAVVLVAPGGPAAKAGFVVGDVILSWDGQEVYDATELTLLVGKTAVGDNVTVILLREGERREIQLTVEERPVRFQR